MDIRSPFFKNIASILVGILFVNPVVSLAADLALDAAAGGNASLGQAGNGVPVVNIATPNSKGLSHNQFNEYNVGQQGLILNNAGQATQSTQLGGIILGNANLSNGAAGLILNEVTGSNPSQLRGYTEVAGQSAGVIVANPHGISCDGCGFINTPRVTLSTGKPFIEQGELKRFDVDQGEILIHGAGLNASNIDQFDLITRSARINADLHANQLNIVVGRNQVDATTLEAKAKADDGSDKPLLALDSSALGGMYAGAIQLVGTERGVGVRLAGDMAASAGDIRIDASGKLTLGRAATSADLNIQAHGLELTRDTYAAGSAELHVNDQLVSRQSLAAGEHVQITARELVNQGSIVAGATVDGSSNQVANLQIKTQQLQNRGVIIAGNQLDVTASGALDNRGGALSAGSLARVEAGSLDNRDSKVVSQGAFELRAGSLNNQDGSLGGEGNVTLDVQGLLDNSQQGTISSRQALSITAGSLNNSIEGKLLSQGDSHIQVEGPLDNHNKGQVVSGGDLQLTVQQELLNGREGLLSASGDLHLHAQSLDNSETGLVASRGHLNVVLDEHLSNSAAGTLAAVGDLSIQTASLNNTDQGLISSNQNLHVVAADVDNRQGLLVSEGSAYVSATQFDNRDGELSSNQSLLLVASNLDNRDSGRIITAGTLELASEQLLNSVQGLLSGWQGVRIHASGLDNSDGGTVSSREGGLFIQLAGLLSNSKAGALVSRGPMDIMAEALDNSAQGIVSSEADVQLALTGDLINADQGLISSQGELQIQAQDVDNQAGQVAGHSLQLNGRSLDNRGGQIVIDTTAQLILQQAMDNSAGAQLVSGSDLTVQAGSIDNRSGRLASEGSMTLAGGSLDNSEQGNVAANQQLDVELNGALDNSSDGLIYSVANNLTIDAHSLRNDGGTVQSQGDMRVNVSTELSNRDGTMLSVGSDLELQAGSLDNSEAGILNSVNGWLRAVVFGLFDNRSGLTQAQQIELQAGQLNNDAGHLSAIGGDNQITATALSSEAGGIFARHLLSIAANELNNREGTLAAERLSLQLSGAFDNRGGLVEGDSLWVQAGVLDNREGALRALEAAANTEISLSGALDNRAGVIETAAFDFNLNLGSLNNQGGSIVHVGAGRLGLASAQLVEAGGEVITTGELQVDASSWVHSGLLQAAQLVLNVDHFTLTQTGRLLATQSLTGTGIHWSNAGLIASDGELDIDLDGTYSATGRLSGLGAMNLQADRVELAASGSIAANSDMQLAVRELTNRGRVNGSDNVWLQANSIDNRGTLSAAGQLQVDADLLRNERGLIVAGEDMLLNVDRLVNLQADIYSLGGILVQGRQPNTASSELENVSATLEAIDNLTIRSAQLINRKEDFRLERDQLSGVIDILCYDCSGDHHNVDYVATEVFESRITADSPAAQILTGGNLDIEAGALLNQYSTIASAGDMRIIAGTLDNVGGALTRDTRVRTWNTGRVTDGTDERFRANYIYPYNAAPVPKELPLEALSVYYFVGLVGDVTTSTDIGAGAPAIIQAGGNAFIQVAGNLNNDVVRQAPVHVGSDIGVESGVASGTVPVFVTLNPQLPPDLSQQQVNPIALPGFSLPEGENGLFRLSGRQGHVGSGDLAVDGALPPQQGVSGVGPQAGPTGQASGHRYLIETNPALTDLRQFMSSDYLLAQMGFDPDAAQKRLGDGLYEQRLVREAIIARTGQRYLAGMSNDEAMFRYLMDNALVSKDALTLSLGVALTAEQVAALTHDIVWMEEYEVMGERVLVPVLYLAQAEGRLAPNGALIQAQNLTLISGDDLRNQGTLRATAGTLDVMAGNISNSGLMQAHERIQLVALDSIRNSLGGVISGQDVALSAVTGDIINERTATYYQNEGAGWRQGGTLLDSAARIEAAGDLALNAGRDLLNIGGALQAGGNASLSAGNDIVISSVEESSELMRQDRRHFIERGSVTQHGSEINVGGNLQASAENDLTIIASRVEAGGDVTLAADGDVLIASAANEQHDVYRYRRSDKKVTRENSLVQQQGAEVIAAGDVTVLAGQNLVAVASRIEAGGEAYLVAGDQLALLAAEDLDHSFYEKKSKGSFGRKSFRSDQVTRITQQGTAITTGGNLALISGGDQVYQAAELRSGADLELTSGGAITFEGVMDLHQESHEKSKSSWAWQSAKGKGNTDETLIQSQLIAQGDLIVSAVEGLQIDIKEINQRSISQTIDAMVQAEPELLWMKEIEQRGDVDWRLVKEVHDSFSYSSSGLSGPAAMVVAIAVAYFTAGTASGMVAGLGGGAGATATAGTAWATATATTAAGWANVAATAAITSAASGAAISTINNGGDLGDVLKEITSSDALKGYITAGITAGFTSGVLDQAFGVTGDNINNVTRGFDLSKPGELAQFGSYLGAQGAVQAVAQTTINGGSLGDNLQSALTNKVHHLLQAAAFNAVGDYSESTNGFADGSPEKIALHAMVGGMLSEATGGDFGTGALAGGANEALIERLSGLIKDDRNLELAVSQLIGIAAATATGGDYAKAAELAKNATAYNRQLHPEEVSRIKGQADELAEELGISRAEAERRLAEAQAYFVDEQFRQVIESQGVILDEATLRHLGIALAPLAHQYDVAPTGDVPEILDSNRVYSPEETLALLQSYHSNHAEAFSDSLMYAHYLSGWSASAIEQKQFYDANLNYSDRADLSGTSFGGLAGTNAAVIEMVQGFNELVLALKNDFTGTSEEVALALLAAASRPDLAVGDFLQAEKDAETQAYLHRLQGDNESAAYVEQKWKTEFALQFVATSRAGALGRVGGGKATSKVIAQYGPTNQGPLPKGIVDTFRSGTYSEVVTQQPTTLYRVYGGTAQELGGYWTATKPAGPVQSIVDSALSPQWGNTATNVVKIEVPIGTKYFEGVAAPQGGLVGGGSQVLFPKDFKIDNSWIRQ